MLPLSYAFEPTSLRWSLGSQDICFKNKYGSTPHLPFLQTCSTSSIFLIRKKPIRFLSDFFTYGQVLPTHRLKHSAHGGLFQPTMTQAIRLLSSQPYQPRPGSRRSPASLPPNDPFTDGSLTYSSTGADSFPAPSAYAANRHSWVHIFPEGLVHQHRDVDLRYFKWGVSRLILEAEPAPAVVPMFIDGTQRVMAEDRAFPRFVPRVGKRLRIAFGDTLDFDATFGDLRRRWQALVRRSSGTAADGEGQPTAALALGELTGELRDGEEARAIRLEVARRVREAVLQVRESLDYPAPDPSFALRDTWAPDERKEEKKYKSSVDDSEVNQD